MKFPSYQYIWFIVPLACQELRERLCSIPRGVFCHVLGGELKYIFCSTVVSLPVSGCGSPL